jgi:CDP-glucose 4,6-dehydratase
LGFPLVLPERAGEAMTNRLSATFKGRRVLVTGHTGFKGAWLSEWLIGLGADVAGYALAAQADNSLFSQLGLSNRMRHVLADVRDGRRLAHEVGEVQPDFVFHLAAQSLVRESYIRPAETFDTNVMGTIHVLEALRLLKRPCAVVVVTTDKCYHNEEWIYGYRETDPLGGHDAYSASKAAAEIATAAWRSSFFRRSPVRIATARAGNVIGGGDWATDRIVPDCIRALSVGQPIPVRNRYATRPWQHVLEPLAGYLWLAASLVDRPVETARDAGLDSAFNFGPGPDSNRTVGDLVDQIVACWPGSWADATDETAPHEARFLHLCTDKAAALLRWRAVWSFNDTVRETVNWYRAAISDPSAIRANTVRQIAEYTASAEAAGLAWAAMS